MAGGALDFHFFTRAQPRGRGVAVKGAVRWLDSGVGSLAGVTPCPSVSISPALLQALNLDPMEVAKAKNGLPPFESQTDPPGSPPWVTSQLPLFATKYLSLGEELTRLGFGAGMWPSRLPAGTLVCQPHCTPGVEASGRPQGLVVLVLL